MKTSSRIKKVSAGVLEEFKDIPTSTISDVLDSLGIMGVITGILPIVEGVRLFGSAVTVKEVSGPRGAYSLDEFDVGSVIEVADKGDVIVFDLGGKPVSTWGGLASRAAINKGLAGVVVDGGVRDVDEIRHLKFPVFAKHRVPTTGKTRVRMLSINEPIECSGVKVRLGDMIVGDSTGLVVLPSEMALDILQKAKELEEVERRFESELKRGSSFKETAKRLRHV